MEEPQPTINHFGVLVDYLADYPPAQLEALAELYGAAEATPSALARQWCQNPEAFVEIVEETLRTESAWSALRELAYEHDAPFETDWMGLSAQNQLAEAGFINSLVTSSLDDRDVVIPSALAALVAPKLIDTRPSLAILLGKEDEQRVRNLAREYDLSDSGSRVEVILRIMDFVVQPENIEKLAQWVPNPDWLGMAMMILELGGVCYWREVFGHDPTENGEANQGGDVVPLMGREERSQEKRMAETLIDLGIVYRFPAPETDYTMVAVPEALWHPLWGLGHDWMLDWVYQSHLALEDGGLGGDREGRRIDLQSLGKWLVCESVTGDLHLEGTEVDADSRERLEGKIATAHHSPLQPAFANLFELSVLRRGLDGFVTLGAEYQTLLDMPGEAFVRDVLYEWCGGFIGSAFEEHLPKAIGLDEQWREKAMEVLRARHEFIPHWMEFEGVPQERTGAGCLRETDEGTPELLATELGIANGYVWSAKMIWLDMLSLLPTGRWYPFDGLVDLMEMVSAACLYSQVGQLLEDPRSYFYVPVQRTSLLEDPFHISEFEQWLGEVVDSLLVPLGVADTRDDDEYVWLATDRLRIETPPGWSQEDRTGLISRITGIEPGEFALPDNQNFSLRTVAEPTEAAPGEVPFELAVDAMLEATRDREIGSVTADGLIVGARADAGE